MYSISLFVLLFHWMMVISALPVDRIRKGKYFDRVVIIVFENQGYMIASNDKYLSSLTSQYEGFSLTNYLAITHPSQPNYVALISGSTNGTVDDKEANIDRNTIVDLLEPKGISWKVYQEDYLGSCDKQMKMGLYVRKHNPFISFKNIQTNKSRCEKIVNSNELDKDIKDDNVPQFVFYTPNMKNDAHDTNMTFGSNWLKNFFKSRIHQKAFNKNTLFVITFDEDDGSTTDNKVFTILFGPDFHPSTNKKYDDKQYDHYSLLATIEDNWNLGDLGQQDMYAKKIEI